MDEERIALVLAKTAELRSKIVNCIQKTTSNVEREGEVRESKASEASPDAENQQEEEEEESLLNIRDALESLEGQLSSLQALQQQQWYEKEAALAEIEYSQKKLLKELKEYKGKDLEVIQEAISFAGESDDSTDLLLPPYPSRPSRSSISENGHLHTRKISQNGATIGGLKNLQNGANNLQESDSDPRRNLPGGGPFRSVKVLIGKAAKAALTIVGVIAILSLAGFEPRLRKSDNNGFKLSNLFKLQGNDENGLNGECPPGKVAVMEDGEMRCVVKERVEVPFESVVDTPDVSFGCG